MSSDSPQAFAIVDGHAHVSSTHFMPKTFMEGVVDNISVQLEARNIPVNRRAIMELYLSKMQDHECDELIRDMDEIGFAETVLLLPDYTFALGDSELTIQEMFDCHRAILRRHINRFRVFAGVDPRWGRDGIELFERGIRDFGFHGLKLYPPCGYRPDDRSLYPYYEICQHYRVPVLTHIGATSPVLRFDTSLPLMIDGPALDFPSVDFILAHGSVHYTDECAMMCSHRPNVYVDVSGFAGSSLASLRRIFERGINHKIIFGTDWPVFRLQGSQQQIFSRIFVDSSPFLEEQTNEDKQNFFAGTIRRLLAKRRVLASTDPHAASPSWKV